jgi:hypothetical protein
MSGRDGRLRALLHVGAGDRGNVPHLRWRESGRGYFQTHQVVMQR